MPVPGSVTELRELGRGAHGSAHLAVDETGERIVVKKVNMSGMSSQERAKAWDEVSNLVACHHPHVVEYRGAHQEGDTLCIYMEYCGGGNLESALRAHESSVSPVDTDVVMDWFTQILLGLQAVHDLGVVHRDVKPANIFLTRRNIVKIGDFGVSRQLGSHTGAAATLVGTPLFLAPEQLQGEPYGTKADVWALGVLLFRMCCGRYPFNAPNLPILAMRVCTGPPVEVPDAVPADVAGLIRDMLERDSHARPAVVDCLGKPAVARHLQRLSCELLGLSRIRRPSSTDRGGSLPAVAVFGVRREERSRLEAKALEMGEKIHAELMARKIRTHEAGTLRAVAVADSMLIVTQPADQRRKLLQHSHTRVYHFYDLVAVHEKPPTGVDLFFRKEAEHLVPTGGDEGAGGLAALRLSFEADAFKFFAFTLAMVLSCVHSGFTALCVAPSPLPRVRWSGPRGPESPGAAPNEAHRVEAIRAVATWHGLPRTALNAPAIARMLAQRPKHLYLADALGPEANVQGAGRAALAVLCLAVDVEELHVDTRDLPLTPGNIKALKQAVCMLRPSLRVLAVYVGLPWSWSVRTVSKAAKTAGVHLRVAKLATDHRGRPSEETSERCLGPPATVRALSTTIIPPRRASVPTGTSFIREADNGTDARRFEWFFALLAWLRACLLLLLRMVKWT